MPPACYDHWRVFGALEPLCFIYFPFPCTGASVRASSVWFVRNSCVDCLWCRGRSGRHRPAASEAVGLLASVRTSSVLVAERNRDPNELKVSGVYAGSADADARATWRFFL